MKLLLFFLIFASSLVAKADEPLRFEFTHLEGKTVQIELDPRNNFDASTLDMYYTLRPELQKEFLKKRRSILIKIFEAIKSLRPSRFFVKAKELGIQFAKKRAKSRDMKNGQAERTRSQMAYEKLWQSHLRKKSSFQAQFDQRVADVLMNQIDKTLFINAARLVGSPISGVSLGMGLSGAIGIGDGHIGKAISRALNKTSNFFNQEKIQLFGLGFDFEVGIQLGRDRLEKKIFLSPYLDWGRKLGQVTIPAHEIVLAFKALKQNYLTRVEPQKIVSVEKMIYPVGLVMTSSPNSAGFGIMPGIALPPVISTLATYELKSNRVNLFNVTISYEKSEKVLKGCVRFIRDIIKVKK